jgi:DNA-3-methyladenine glycosylase II
VLQNRFESLTDASTWKRGIAHLKHRDKALAKVIDGLGRYGKFETYSDSYGAIVESIVFQQLAGKAAQSILKRFKKIYGGKLPKPARFLLTEEKEVRGSGISPQKYSYIKDLCIRLEGGLLELEELRLMDNEDVIDALDEVKGIGRWTAEMFLIFSLARTDVLPMDDLGIRKAVQKAYGMRRLPEKEDFEKLARKWHPYESIASLYLWRSHD